MRVPVKCLAVTCLKTVSDTALYIKMVTTAENDQLMLQATGQPKIPLEYEGDDKFGFSAAGIEFQFSKDKKGFTLNQGGQKFEFTKD